MTTTSSSVDFFGIDVSSQAAAELSQRRALEQYCLPDTESARSGAAAGPVTGATAGSVAESVAAITAEITAAIPANKTAQTTTGTLANPGSRAAPRQSLAVVLEQRFVQTPDRRVWTPATNAYGFWQRYLEVFDQVKVIARVQPVAQAPSDWKQADGPQVSFVPIPYYVGPVQYLRRASQVRRALAQAIAPEDAVILRVGSRLAMDLAPWLHRHRHPYAVEVVADPYDVFAPGSIRHPLRPYFRWSNTRALEQQCLGAIAAAYVTESALQQRYPCPQYQVGVSDVELTDQCFAPQPRNYAATGDPDAAPDVAFPPAQLLYVGTLAQLYKAPHILLDAFAATCHNGINAHLTLVGEGQYRGELERQAQRLGVGDRVTFRGQLPPNEVRAALAQASLFVLPSFQEGLPRAMVEAMAQGLPCIGSRVGGVPELLADEDLVWPGDVADLSRKLYQTLTSPERLTAMAQRNWQRAQDFRGAALRERRRAFYRHLRRATEAWRRAESLA